MPFTVIVLTKSFLSDPKYLTTLVTALVKKAGGEIRISQTEMEDVTLSDLISMYYDISTEEIILTAMNINALADTEFEN